MQSLNNRQTLDILAITELINKSKNINDIEKIILEKVNLYGIDRIFAGIIPQQAAKMQEQRANVMFGNWPKEWAERYFLRGYLERDPTIHHIRHSNHTLPWTLISSKKSIVMNEASEFQLHDGITIPMISIDGIKIGMSFAGAHISKAPEFHLLCQFISAVSTARVLEIIKNQKSQHNLNISTAELNCLKWAVEGKTNSEIGQILSISEKTVEKHMSNCYLKTNTLNRTQLTAVSLRHGLIT